MTEKPGGLKEGILENARSLREGLLGIDKQLAVGVIAVLLLVLGYFFIYIPLQKTDVHVRVYDNGTGKPIEAKVVLLGEHQVILEKETLNGAANFIGVLRRKGMRVAVTANGYLAGGGDALDWTDVYLEKQVAAPSKADFLIISAKAALARKYGEATAGIIERKMHDLANVAKGEGLKSEVVMIDNAASMKPFGAAAANTQSKQSALAAVKALTQRLAPAYILIVGGERIVPYQLAQNPLAASPERLAFDFIIQESPTIETDNPYGVLHDYGEAGKYYPEIAVGRMPDGSEETADGDTILIEMLDNAISQHKKKAPSARTFSLVSDDSLLDYYAKFEFQSTQNNVLKSPAFYYYDYEKMAVNGHALETIRQGVANSSFVIILLHGNEPGQEQAFLGKGFNTNEELLSLTAPMAGQMDFNGKVVLADSCWGANTDRTSKGSIALAALRGGAKAFVGSTQAALSISRSSYKPQASAQGIEYLGVSNSLLYLTFKNALLGQRLGDAFTKAKRSLSWGSYPEYLTAQEFVYYGDPTLYA